MNALTHFFRSNRYPPHHCGLTRYFFYSALILVGAFTWAALWSVLGQRLMGDDLWAIYKPVETVAALRGGGLVVLHGGGLMIILGLIGFLWLFMTGFAARGAALRERGHRIAELEARLNDRSAS